MESVTVAIPSNAPGGLDAPLSAHFGHCDVYTLITVTDGEATEVRTVTNQGHQEGGCLAPVQTLSQMGVGVLLAAGMGMRPLAAFQQVGINVFFAGGQSTVNGALRAYLAGSMPAFDASAVCKGSGHCHH